MVRDERRALAEPRHRLDSFALVRAFDRSIDGVEGRGIRRDRNLAAESAREPDGALPRCDCFFDRC